MKDLKLISFIKDRKGYDFIQGGNPFHFVFNWNEAKRDTLIGNLTSCKGETRTSKFSLLWDMKGYNFIQTVQKKSEQSTFVDSQDLLISWVHQ